MLTGGPEQREYDRAEHPVRGLEHHKAELLLLPHGPDCTKEAFAS